MFVSTQDREYFECIVDPTERAVTLDALTAFRRSDMVFVGDPVPSVSLTDLNSGEAFALDEPRTKPLVLFFGSYT